MNEFQRYRKKPVIIQARKLEEVVNIPTLEGVMRGEIGDYLIIGTAGEMYPCKPDVFAQVYELIAESEEGTSLE